MQPRSRAISAPCRHDSSLPHLPKEKSVKRRLKIAVFTVIAAVLSIMATAGAAQPVSTHHVRDAVRRGEVAPNGRLSQNQVLQLDLVLPLRDPLGLKKVLADVYNPKSPNFRQWLTPAEFTARFGPTQEQYDEVLS